jgi:hypothetical protein
MRISVRMLVVSALAFAGCVSAGVANHDRDPILVMLGSTSVRYNRDIHVATENLADSPATLWPQLKAAIAGMGLRVTVVDSASHLIGVQNAELNGRFEDAPVARVLDCGLTPMGTSRANAYRVWLTVGGQLQPATTGSTLRITVFGMAQDPSSSSTAVQCASTGAIESELAKRLGAL